MLEIYQKNYWVENFSTIKEDLTELKIEPLVQYIGDNQWGENIGIDKEWFVAPPGVDHYRLLAFLSKKLLSGTILEIGSLFGNSALAFSYNPFVDVYAFDIANQISLKQIPKNVTFTFDDVLKHPNTILSSDIMLVDTWHHVTFEKELFSFLEQNKYRGLIVLDDIHMTPIMEEWWNSIEQEKLDITELGHITGTGLVFFNLEKGL